MHEIIAYNKVTRIWIWIYFIVVFGFGFGFNYLDLDLDRIRIFIKVNPLLSGAHSTHYQTKEYDQTMHTVPRRRFLFLDFFGAIPLYK